MPVTRRRHAGTPTGDAHSHALALLAGRPYGVEELRRRLIRDGHPAADIEDAIARLAKVNLVDDPVFARQFARSRLVSGGTAPRRVRQELARRGVAGPVADAAVAEVIADEDIDLLGKLEQVARRRAAVLTGLEPGVRKRRLYAFLARRGYDSDAIARVIASVIGDLAEDRR